MKESLLKNIQSTHKAKMNSDDITILSIKIR